MSESDGSRESQEYDLSHRKAKQPDDKITLVIKIKIVTAFITVLGSALMGLTICLWCHGIVEPNLGTGFRKNPLLIAGPNDIIHHHEHLHKYNVTPPKASQKNPYPDGKPKDNSTNLNNTVDIPREPVEIYHPPKPKHQGLRWVNMTLEADHETWKLPPDAVRGGTDKDGAPMYVSRALFHGDLIPGKLIPKRKKMYVSRDKFEFQMDLHCQVLCGTNWGWRTACCGNMPDDAFEAGMTDYGEPLYICRVTRKNVTTCGKVHPSHKVCYTPYDGMEFLDSVYDILVSW